MKKTGRFIFLTTILVLVFSSISLAQNAADKSWGAFWAKFTKAVNTKNRAAVKSLMATEKDFFSGGGGETREEWLDLVQQQKWWGLLQKSVRQGTKVDNYEGKPGRVTKDNHLTFLYIRGKWRFTGPMGD